MSDLQKYIDETLADLEENRIGRIAKLMAENERLREELLAAFEEIKLRSASLANAQEELARATAMPTATEAARNVALEKKVDELREELDAIKDERLLQGCLCTGIHTHSHGVCNTCNLPVIDWIDAYNAIAQGREHSERPAGAEG